MKGHRNKARALSYVLLIIVLAHTAIIALWAGPNNPIKEAIGTQKIRSYVNPIFEQDWHIFAPTPKRVSVELDVRAQMIDPETGEIYVTPWYALVAGENEMIRHNPSPPRTAFLARRTSLSLHNAAGDMNEDQRAVTEESFHTPQAPLLADVLREAPAKSGANSGKINTYLKYDEMVTGLATLTAAVLNEGEVHAIQYRTAKGFVPRFEDRAHTKMADVTKTGYSYGWRPAPAVADVEVAHFAPYANRMPLAEVQE